MSPEPIPYAINAKTNASVPLAQVTACLAPVYCSSFSSSSFTSGPIIYFP